MGVISDEFWAVGEPVMPSDVGKRGSRFGDHRLILEGIAWRFRTGSPWRDLPAEFGPWQTVWARHRTWSEDGTWDRIHTTLMGQADAAGRVDWSVNVDSTINRAHQHGTNLPRDTGGTTELQQSAPGVA